jgi:two-component system OmpR family response regulator
MIRVLLVDDEEELVTTLKERLAYRDIEADYSLNGADAIQKIRQVKYDVLVLDLKLPGIGGLDTMKVIKGERPDLPIILITGHGEFETGTELPQGISEYLPKPIAINRLVEAITKAVKQDE